MNMEKEVLTLNIDDVLPNRFQPRIKFKEENISELAESIKEHGVIQPIVVRKISDKYEIIAGERRYKASVLAGKTTIPAIVTNLDDKNSAEVALIENVQRQNLTPIEEAISYKKILDMGYINQSDLAEKLGKTQSTIANKLRLLNLDEEVQDALLNEKISERHARSLLRLDKMRQVQMLNRIINERMTVRKTDEEIAKILNEEPESEDNQKTLETLSDNKLNNSIETSENNSQEETSEIEILDFNINNEKESELEKTIELPKLEKEEYDMENNIENNIENNKFNIPTGPIIEESNNQNINMSNLVSNIPEESNNQNINISNSISNIQEEVPNNIQISNEQIKEISDYPIDEIASNNSSENSNAEVSPSQPISENMISLNNEVNMEQNQTNGMIDINSQINQESNLNTNNLDTVNQNINTNNIISSSSNEDSTLNMDNINVEINNPSNPGPRKFFNMFDDSIAPAPENYVDDIEQQQVNINFGQNETEVMNPFNFNPQLISENVVEENTNQPSKGQSTIDDMFTNKNEELQQSIQNNVIDESPFENVLNPYSLNDDTQFTNLNQEMQQSTQNNIENVAPVQSVIETQNEIKPQQRFVTGNLQMVINTVRNCAATIEKYGFKLQIEEVDLEDMYQVTFKINKNN